MSQQITAVTTQFQPIISVKKKSIIGIEALSRGLDMENGEIISPLILFEQASDEIQRLIDLDRVCRESALVNFKKIKQHYKDLLLFMNIESSILDKVRNSNYLIDRVLEIGLKPHDIVIEINESRINDIDALVCFVERYREYGFIIALDDIGAGFSNLNRIPLLNPDIIKIDRFLLKNINNDHYKREVFKSLVDLASNTGSLVVAEGTENDEEAILATELGADMIQGYLFSKPMSWFSAAETIDKISDFVKAYKHSMNITNEAKKSLIGKLNSISYSIVDDLEKVPEESFEDILKEKIKQEEEIECMYILNADGIQSSNTVLKPNYQTKSKNILFLPASKGTDHSIKGYYYHLVHNNNKNYISNKYMSMATGNMCLTLSVIFTGLSGKMNILCIDFLAK